MLQPAASWRGKEDGHENDSVDCIKVNPSPDSENWFGTKKNERNNGKCEGQLSDGPREDIVVDLGWKGLLRDVRGKEEWANIATSICLL